MSEGYNATKILTWVLGIVGGLAVMGVAASVGMLIDTGKKLASIEATMAENKAERQRQVGELERRLGRVEARVYGENGE